MIATRQTRYTMTGDRVNVIIDRESFFLPLLRFVVVSFDFEFSRMIRMYTVVVCAEHVEGVVSLIL